MLHQFVIVKVDYLNNHNLVKLADLDAQLVIPVLITAQIVKQECKEISKNQFVGVMLDIMMTEQILIVRLVPIHAQPVKLILPNALPVDMEEIEK